MQTYIFQFSFDEFQFSCPIRCSSLVEFMNRCGRFDVDLKSFCTNYWISFVIKHKLQQDDVPVLQKAQKNADDDKTTRHDYLLWSKCVRSVLLNHLLVWSKCSLLSNFRSFFLSPFDSFFSVFFILTLLTLLTHIHSSHSSQSSHSFHSSHSSRYLEVCTEYWCHTFTAWIYIHTEKANGIVEKRCKRYQTLMLDRYTNILHLRVKQA